MLLDEKVVHMPWPIIISSTIRWIHACFALCKNLIGCIGCYIHHHYDGLIQSHHEIKTNKYLTFGVQGEHRTCDTEQMCEL